MGFLVDTRPGGSVVSGRRRLLPFVGKRERRISFSGTLEERPRVRFWRRERGLAMAERIPMTRAGYQKLEEELRRLKTEERPRIVKEIEVARSHGDISENAEFHAAKDRQSHVEGRIRIVEDRLARAQVIDPSGQSPSAVRFGATVVLVDVETEEKVTYTLVGEDESDVSVGLISISSPVARAILGKGIEETVTVRVPRGTREFTILEIRFE
jgi:transcription elongation factor GreA